jgi:hypothetical protein
MLTSKVQPRDKRKEVMKNVSATMWLMRRGEEIYACDQVALGVVVSKHWSNGLPHTHQDFGTNQITLTSTEHG